MGLPAVDYLTPPAVVAPYAAAVYAYASFFFLKLSNVRLIMFLEHLSVY